MSVSDEPSHVTDRDCIALEDPELNAVDLGEHASELSGSEAHTAALPHLRSTVSAADTVRHLLLDHNRGSILAFEALWGLAMPFAAYATILPGYLKNLGVPNAWIALVPALFTGGLALTQPASAWAIRPGPRRLRIMLGSYAAGSFGYILLGLLVLAGVRHPAVGLAASLLAVAAFAVGVGLGDPQYVALVVAAVDPELRGRFFGLRAVCVGVGGVLGGCLAGWVLQLAPAPANFGWSLLLGGILYLASTLSMVGFRDRPEPITEARTSFAAFMRERVLPRIRSVEFRAFLVAVVFFALAVCGFPFLSLLLKERLHASDRIYGLLGGLFMGCTLVMSWVLGCVCDRWGSRRGFQLSLFCYALGVTGCLTLRHPGMLLVAYVLASVWLPGSMIPMTDLSLRLAVPHDHRAGAAEITATMMVVMAPAKLLGPVLVGAGIDHWGYIPALGFCVLCALAAAGVLSVGARAE